MLIYFHYMSCRLKYHYHLSIIIIIIIKLFYLIYPEINWFMNRLIHYFNTTIENCFISFISQKFNPSIFAKKHIMTYIIHSTACFLQNDNPISAISASKVLSSNVWAFNNLLQCNSCSSTSFTFTWFWFCINKVIAHTCYSSLVFIIFSIFSNFINTIS